MRRPIRGGDFMAAGSVELNFPLAGDLLRGVTFFDAGTVNRELDMGTIRTSVGFGFRLTLPFFGQVPIALDFGFPIGRAISGRRVGCRVGKTVGSEGRTAAARPGSAAARLGPGRPGPNKMLM